VLNSAASDPVLYRKEGGILVITINNPPVNALAKQVRMAMAEFLELSGDDDQVRAVVVCGNGRNLCGGADIREFNTPDRQVRPMTRDLMNLIEAMEKPVVAAIHGPTLGGGLELALGCDLLIGGESARLGDTHGQWGLVPVWGMSVRLPERVGRSMAKELMFTSRRIDAVEAQRIGLLDRVVPDRELDAVVEALCAEIVANSAGTNRIVKALLADAAERTRSDGLHHERSLPHGRPEDMADRMRAGGR